MLGLIQDPRSNYSHKGWGAVGLKMVPVETNASGTSTVQYHNISNHKIVSLIPPPVLLQRQLRHCYGNANPGDFPLCANPSIALYLLSHYDFDAQDLAKLEATCSFFRHPAQIIPSPELSLAELAALDMCRKRTSFKLMTIEQQEDLKHRCGGSWKLVYMFLLAGETCTRREKSQVVAGPGHSIAVTSQGAVYSFGLNNWGELGHGNTQDISCPRLIRSLQGIRIIHAAVGLGKTMLTSDTGQVYAFGNNSHGDSEFGPPTNNITTTPQLIESLKDIFVVQVTMGHFFTAVLSREGRVYTFSWGDEDKLCHQTNPSDQLPRPLSGALENIPVVQIAAGHCFLLALACEPTGMSVYSVGCGRGGKLGHGGRNDEKQPRLIEHFRTMNFDPVAIAAGSWHSAAVGKDGRVCTWGWGQCGCLGHGNEDSQSHPKVVEGLAHVKAVKVATGYYTTFVVAEDGDVYSFGCGMWSSLGHNPPAAVAADEQGRRVFQNSLAPEPLALLKKQANNERVVQISSTSSLFSASHTIALTESGEVYAFGAGDNGQLGVELEADQNERANPERLDIINLNSSST